MCDMIPMLFGNNQIGPNLFSPGLFSKWRIGTYMYLICSRQKLD